MARVGDWGAGWVAARSVSADGSVRTLPDDFDPWKLRVILTANGGEPAHE